MWLEYVLRESILRGGILFLLFVICYWPIRKYFSSLFWNVLLCFWTNVCSSFVTIPWELEWKMHSVFRLQSLVYINFWDWKHVCTYLLSTWSWTKQDLKSSNVSVFHNFSSMNVHDDSHPGVLGRALLFLFNAFGSEFNRIRYSVWICLM